MPDLRTELERIRTLRAHTAGRGRPHDFLPRFEDLVARGDDDALVELLAELVPTYTPSRPSLDDGAANEPHAAPAAHAA